MWLGCMAYGVEVRVYVRVGLSVGFSLVVRV